MHYLKVFGAREAIDVTFANSDLSLSVLDGADLVHISLDLITKVTYFHLQIENVLIGLVVFRMQLRHLLIKFDFKWEFLHLSVDALDVELTSKI